MMEYSKRVSADYRISATIIQEIYDPMYTGILKRIPDGYIIEITQGHFLTKGVVPSSQYVITEEGDVVSKKETLQSYWYKILEGHVFYCICNEGDEKLVSITESELLKVKDALSPAIQNKSTVVEFGILIDRENHVFQPYLIDFVDDGANSMIEKNDIEDGVVSKGTISGKIVNMKETRYESLEMPDSQLDMHLHNEFRDQKVRPNKTGSEKNKIFFCKRPVISLLEIIDNHDPATIGFVFEEGSVLCHVAVVLREKGIPAIKTGVAPDEFREGVCTIDAGSAGLAGRDRVRYE